MNVIIDRYCVFYYVMSDQDYVQKNEIADVIELLISHKILLQSTISGDMPIGLPNN